MQPVLHASPLQGFTDYRFRNEFARYFGGIDFYYAPYIRIENSKMHKKNAFRDILPENNTAQPLIPQVLTKDAGDFMYVANHIQSLGYKQINWNLGCPYPMVTKRGLGAGLLSGPKHIDRVLNAVFSGTSIDISIKLRLGNENQNEIFDVLQVLEKYPFKNIAIHPRTATQLYKGVPDLDSFAKCTEKTTQPVVYNGDITTVDRYNELKERFPGIEQWMIGRGLIHDPFLPKMIKDKANRYPTDKEERFAAFHNRLVDDYQQALSGDKHLVMKMAQYWEYFIWMFPNAGRLAKKVKKAKTKTDYQRAVQQITATGMR